MTPDYEAMLGWGRLQPDSPWTASNIRHMQMRSDEGIEFGARKSNFRYQGHHILPVAFIRQHSITEVRRFWNQVTWL
jgi:hypothetical protein